MGLTMKDVVLHSSRVYPNHVSLICGEEVRTYLELHNRTTQLANALEHKFGCGNKDHISVISPNDVRYVEVYYASAKIGAVTCPVLHVLSRAEIIAVLNNFESKTLFIHEDLIETVISVRKDLHHVQNFVVFAKTNQGATRGISGL
jgi:acyl-CoA synthetase (AMP-forming)/AMP-acid ligase II